MSEPPLLSASEARPADGPSVSRPWTYTISVRALCEFTDKHGDLDRRFTPSATALEGIKGQQTVASRRGADYETEIALDTWSGPLCVRGRADGYDPRRRCLEEIKTIRGHPDEIPENRRRLHWAQLETYGALFCRVRGLDEIALALVYLDVASQQEVELRQVFGAAELDAAFDARCARFLAWAEQEARHRRGRDEGLSGLDFPQAPFRPGQRELAERVYRTVARGHSLLAQAPTGIGKTVGTLFPALRAMPRHGIDKLAFLTCKGTGRFAALEALQRMRDSIPGRPLRVLTLVPKDQACENPDKACHPQSCPLAAGFYDRLPAARLEALEAGWADPTAQRQVALRHGLCPYYLGQALVPWADVLVGDVNHLFDMGGVLWGLQQAYGWRLAVLVDEAHNLVERARQMYSAEWPLARLRRAAGDAPATVRPALQALYRAAAELAAGGASEDLSAPASSAAPQGAARAAVAAPTRADYVVWTEMPDRFFQALQTATAALAEHFHQQPLATGAMLDFYFDLQRFARLAENLGPHSLFDLQRGLPEGGGPITASEDAAAVLSIRNVVPGAYLRPRFREVHSTTLFSATLAPPQYAVRLLGLPEETGWIDVPPAFAPEHLRVQIAGRLSTRYVHRDRSLAGLVSLMAHQFDQHPGNYLAFFSSHDYLAKVADQLARVRPGLAQWRQDRAMSTEARQAFLARFVSGGQGIGFAVLGGVFAEGIDLPGTRLIGAFIATLGLPPVSPVQEQIALRLRALFGADAGYEDLVPAMQKVVQAAGRVLRTPDDRGWVWLMDDRYRRAEVRALLPAWWQID